MLGSAGTLTGQGYRNPVHELWWIHSQEQAQHGFVFKQTKGRIIHIFYIMLRYLSYIKIVHRLRLSFPCSGFLREDPEGHVRRWADPTLWTLWAHLGSQVIRCLSYSLLDLKILTLVIRLMMDPMSGLNRGYAFITFTTREEALEAVKQVEES